MSEKNADILDQASQVTDFLTARAIEERRAATAPESHPRFDGKHCVDEDCGVEIPEARLAAGRIRCVECQTRIERAQSIFRR